MIFAPKIASKQTAITAPVILMVIFMGFTFSSAVPARNGRGTDNCRSPRWYAGHTGHWVLWLGLPVLHPPRRQAPAPLALSVVLLVPFACLHLTHLALQA